MTKLITNESDDDDSQDAERRQDTDESRAEPGRRKRGKIPSIEECLEALANLAGAVAMGYLKPAQANQIRASYVEILRYHQKNESRHDGKGIADADVVEMMKKDPKMFSVIEPFLTDEQIELIMKNAQDSPDG